MSPEAAAPLTGTMPLPGASTGCRHRAGHQGSRRPWSRIPRSGHLNPAGETRRGAGKATWLLSMATGLDTGRGAPTPRVSGNYPDWGPWLGECSRQRAGLEQRCKVTRAGGCADGESGCCWALLETVSPGAQGTGCRVGARPAGKPSFDPWPGIGTPPEGHCPGRGQLGFSSLQP